MKLFYTRLKLFQTTVEAFLKTIKTFFVLLCLLQPRHLFAAIGNHRSYIQLTILLQ